MRSHSLAQKLKYCGFTLMGLVTLLLAIVSIMGNAEWYSSWWLSSLWWLLALSAICYIAQVRGWKSPAIVLIHGSLLLILIGACLTHFSSREGILKLHSGKPETMLEENAGDLPFSVKLDGFDIVNTPGTSTPADFRAVLSFSDGEQATVSMNKPGEKSGWRLVLLSYEEDAQGVTLSVRHDPAGLFVTYAGYLLFLIAGIVFFLSSGTGMRAALAVLKRAAATACLAFAIGLPAAAHEHVLPVLPESTLRVLSRTPVFTGGRVAPFATLARDFTNTITGSDSWDGYDATQIASGFIFNFNKWKDAPLIKVKGKEMQALLECGSRASFEQFFRAVTSQKLDPEAVARDAKSPLASDLARFEAVSALASGSLLNFFPLADSRGDVHWYSPVDDDIPADTPADVWLFMRKSPGVVNEMIVREDFPEAERVLLKIGEYQRKTCLEGIPSETLLKAEIFYDKVSSPLLPAILSIVAGVALFLLLCFGWRHAPCVALCLVAVLWVWLTGLFIMRWIINSHIPLSNGYETMMFLAWSCVTIPALLSLRVGFRRGFPGQLLLIFGLTGAALAMFVAAMSGSGASITPLQPVLSSPLLSAHVIAVMGAYALFLFMALTGGVTLSTRSASRLESLGALMRVMLYPALFLLGIGIFIGAIWAEVSWGCYWSWDPKEVWALITMLIYAFAVHPRSLPLLARPRAMALFSLLAVLSVAVTYFGVNFLLGGMHSYAS